MDADCQDTTFFLRVLDGSAVARGKMKFTCQNKAHSGLGTENNPGVAKWAKMTKT